jgi:hypothetical protein
MLFSVPFTMVLKIALGGNEETRGLAIFFVRMGVEEKAVLEDESAA